MSETTAPKMTFWAETLEDGTVLPTFRLPYESDPERGPLCEYEGSDEIECSGPEVATGVVADAWIVVCSAHLIQDATQITEAVAHKMLEEM